MKKNDFILGFIIFIIVFKSEVKVRGFVNTVSQIDIIQLLPDRRNLISLDVFPPDNTPAIVFSTLISENKLVYVSGFQNKEGVFFNPFGLEFPNKLANMNPCEGSWVQLTKDCSLIVVEQPISHEFTINLYNCWNLVGYWLPDHMPRETAFYTLLNQSILDIDVGFDDDAVGVMFDPYGPPSLCCNLLEN